MERSLTRKVKHQRNKTNFQILHQSYNKGRNECKTSALVRRSFENVCKINRLENTMKSFKKQICMTQHQYQLNKICKVKVIEKCGVGNFSEVFLVKLTNKCSLLALKKVPVNSEHVNRQEYFSKILKSPFIVKFYDAYYSEQKGKNYLNILMERYTHNLAESLAVEKLNQITVKIYLYQMLRSLHYLHSKNICHRDIKPHNFLINSNRVVLCDFGSSKIINKQKNVAYLYSREYRPPELLFGFQQYGISADIWALGCVAGEMVLRKPLFKGNSTLDQILKILQILGTPNWQKISFTLKKIEYLPKLKGKQLEYVLDEEPESSKFLDLIKNMLKIEPSERITAIQALCHSYFDQIRDETIFWNLKKHVELPNLFYFSKKQIADQEHLLPKLVPFWVKQYCKFYKMKLQNFR